MDVTRAKDLEDNAFLRDTLVKKFDEAMFSVDNQIKGLDSFKRSYEALCKRADEVMKQFDGFMEK